QLASLLRGRLSHRIDPALAVAHQHGLLRRRALDLHEDLTALGAHLFARHQLLRLDAEQASRCLLPRNPRLRQSAHTDRWCAGLPELEEERLRAVFGLLDLVAGFRQETIPVT